MQGEQGKAAVVDFDVQLVDRPVAQDHAGDGFSVAPHETVDRCTHAILGEPAHLQQTGLELFEIGLEMSNSGFRHRMNP